MNPEHPYRSLAAPLIRASILAGIAFYILRLNEGERLSLYIAPRMAPYVRLAALALYLVAAVQVYRAVQTFNGRRPQVACEDCAPAASAAPPSRRAFAYAVFIVPLALFFLTPDTTIGSAMAAQKGMNLSTPDSLKAKSRKDGGGVTGAGTKVGEQTASTDAGTRTGATLDAGAESAASPASAGDSAPGDDSAMVGEDGSAGDADRGTDGDERAGAEAGGQGDAAKTGMNGAGGGTSSSDALDALFPFARSGDVYAQYAKKIYGQPLIEVSEKSYMETLTTLDLYPTAFAGHQATISGFVYRDDTITNDDFVIGRFAIQCCAADALPYGVLVEAPDAASYKNNAWLKISGTLSSTKYGDNDVLLLKADKVESIKPAKDPYVYADPDFG